MKSAMLKSIAVSAFILGLSAQVQAKIVDKVEQSFNVGVDSSFRLENVNGAVNISAWDKDEINVLATVTAEDQRDRDRIVIDMKENSRGVSVETRYKEESSWGNHHSGKVEYEIKVPVSIRLSAIELVNGSLSIDGVHGAIKAELVNGSINVSGMASNGEFSSVNGSIKLDYDQLGKDFNRLEVETVNGSIKVYVPENLNASVDIETMHGSIKNDFGIAADKNSFVGHNLHGTIGSGDVKISMESVNGSVKLLKN